MKRSNYRFLFEFLRAHKDLKIDTPPRDDGEERKERKKVDAHNNTSMVVGFSVLAGEKKFPVSRCFLQRY